MNGSKPMAISGAEIKAWVFRLVAFLVVSGLTWATDHLTDLNLGIWTPVVVTLLTALLDFAKRFFSDTSSTGVGGRPKF